MMTYEQIGTAMQLSPDQVRRIEQTAIAKLRRRLGIDAGYDFAQRPRRRPGIEEVACPCVID